jgi:ubiquinone/menaquinone biosynthesis C-methylase UbiE
MRSLLAAKQLHSFKRSSLPVADEAVETQKAIWDGTKCPDVRPQCPRCRANIDKLECQFCGFEMRVKDGIVYALPPDRATYYACFIEDYEHIRAAEGRFSQEDEFYLCLPYKDVSGKNSKQWRIRARSYDHLMKRVLKHNPQLEGGRILDLGAGNCWMSYRLALARYRPLAVDLLTNDRDGLAAAEHFQNHLSGMFPRVQAELARLPFQDEQFDAVVFNASFHYAEDYVATLREALRCVKVGGMVIISDTPWYSSEESGRRMVLERRTSFLQRYGTASDSIKSLEYLTEDRLRTLEEQLGTRWTIHSPRYGLAWSMRPLVARLFNRREPSRFRIYSTQKA